MAAKYSVIPTERIERSILLIRGQKVMLDSDLAKLYGVETRALARPCQGIAIAPPETSCSSSRGRSLRV